MHLTLKAPNASSSFTSFIAMSQGSSKMGRPRVCPQHLEGLNQCFLGWTDESPEVAFGQREAHLWAERWLLRPENQV